jgi:septal ring factor EnvC (AmiA/AmiB activator)
MKKKNKETKGINLPEIPVGSRQPQYPINCYPITTSDVIEVIARGITAYMNERLTKFHSIAYNPENTALRKVNEQLEADIASLRRDNAAIQNENTTLHTEKVVWDTIRKRVRAEIEEEDRKKSEQKPAPKKAARRR